jgi:hypothetical protein
VGAEPKGRRPAEGDVADVMALIGPVVEALGATQARTDDGARLLGDALRTGSVDVSSWASIVRWVLTEKEETVAAGFATALQGVTLPAAGADAERWDGTTRAVLGAFAGVLQAAQDDRRVDGDAIARNLVAAAGPAVVAALDRSDPAALSGALGTLRMFAPAAREMVGPLTGALRDSDRTVRLGAATLLGALGPQASPAARALEAAREDADPRVRDAAAQALKQIRGE